MSVSSALTRPITAVAWTSNSNTCPSHYTLVNVTEDGASGNFSRGLQFGSKGGYYLCYSKDCSGGMVVADVQIISDKDTIPHGYRYISEFLEHKTCVGKKKRVCARLVPAGSVNSAVLELRLTTKNKSMLQQFTCLGDMHGFVLWCLKGPFSAPGPQAKPRSVSLDLCSLSLDGPGTTQPLKPSNAPMAAPPRLSHRRCTLDMYKPSQTVCETSNHGNIHSITAMDGVPFSLHPKFESQCNRKVSVSALSDVRIKSVKDIENEYNYAFVVEEQAAKRICPTLSES